MEVANISDLQALTGLSHEEAVNLLNASNGCFERALNKHLDVTESRDRNASISSSSTFNTTNARRRAARRADDGRHDGAYERFHDDADTARGHSFLSSCIVAIVRAKRFICRKISDALAAIASLFTTRESERHSSFTALYESKYGSNHPQFYEGTYKEAVAAAIANLKLIAIFIYADKTAFTESFCQRVMGDKDIQALLNENFVLWGETLKTYRSQKEAPVLRVGHYPLLALLLPVSAKSTSVIHCFSGEMNSKIVGDALLTCVSELDIYVAQIDAETRRYTTDREIREQQDREYEEAVKRDAAKRDSQRLEQAKEQDILMETRLRAEQNEKLIKEIKEQRKSLAAKIIEKGAAAQSQSNKDALTNISLRLPSGSKVKHVFSSTETMENLFEWAECCEELEEGRTDIKIPLKFKLYAPLLSKGLEKDSSSFKDIGLFPNAVIYLSSLDDDE